MSEENLGERTLGSLGETIQGSSFVSGQANGFNAGWQLTAKLVGERAAALFVEGKDAEAVRLRDLKKEIEKAGEKIGSQMSESAERYRQPERDAFAELDRREKLKAGAEQSAGSKTGEL